MRYDRAGKAFRFIAGSLGHRRFTAQDMSDHLLRDIGCMDGRRPTCNPDFSAAGGRSGFDHLALLPRAS